MEYPATGYHHITACAGGAQEDVNFFTGIVGQRLAKQTILMDGRFPHYHLYYSNANIEPGSNDHISVQPACREARIRTSSGHHLLGLQRLAVFLEGAFQAARSGSWHGGRALRAKIHAIPTSRRAELRGT